MNKTAFIVFLVLLTFQTGMVQPAEHKTAVTPLKTDTWVSDNGNGTFTNPLFYDEFSDPDLIRVGDDYYLTGTTMHTMPGLPILHSKDLVNWDFVCYASDKLDFGPEFRLENGRSIYGQGIWAPSFRYHNGTYYIFTNVNGRHTQVYTASNPAGPWTHNVMNVSLHDLSVLFDDDGKVYVVWGYNELKMAELNASLTDLVPGTERVIIPAGSGAGEGCHLYKINGKYYITSTNYDPLCYQVCCRADNPWGPYEVTVISAKENLGIGTNYRLSNADRNNPFDVIPLKENFVGSVTLHQGGVVQTQSGEWWAFSMMDHNAVGRLLCLSPVTWKNGWPYLGLEGNLTRSPRTWVKPNTGVTSVSHAPYERSDDFSGKSLKPVWQWNHVPVDGKWSLTERKGYLRLKALPSKDFWQARNSLTQRAVGPVSVPTAELDVRNLKEGDVAGLALLNYPYAWIGVARTGNGLELQWYDQRTDKWQKQPLQASTIWLRACCDFNSDNASFSFSTDGNAFTSFGEEARLIYQLRTFQGIRYALFNYNTKGVEGGYADFNSFVSEEPRCKGLTKPIPYGKVITLTSLADGTVLAGWRNFLRPVAATDSRDDNKAFQFRVLDRGNGRVALQ
ncbi:MAG: glycoside hydrolase 43 family protein, partial [Bacteroidota bacterium]|nr:glycoside hydrolase 43 family protein [Bacteroidota bacterium]